MKISEVIEKLNEIYIQQGDLYVHTMNDEDIFNYDSVEEITAVTIQTEEDRSNIVIIK